MRERLYGWSCVGIGISSSAILGIDHGGDGDDDDDNVTNISIGGAVAPAAAFSTEMAGT